MNKVYLRNFFVCLSIIGFFYLVEMMTLNSKIQTFSIQTFDITKQISNKKTLLIFHKPTCPYCHAMESLDEKMFNEFSKDVDFIKVNFDIAPGKEYDALKKKYGIQTFPTYCFFDKGVEITSLRSKSMKEDVYKTHLNSLLSLHSEKTQ